MEEENMNPAGLGGKLYFCRSEDFEKLRAVTLCMNRFPRVAIKTWRKYQKELHKDLEKLERILKTNGHETPQ